MHQIVNYKIKGWSSFFAILGEDNARARDFLLSFKSLVPSFSRESDSQIVRGLDIECPRDYHIVGGGAVTSFSNGSAQKYLNLQPDVSLVWLADPYQFAAHGGVWSNAYTNFVLSLLYTMNIININQNPARADSGYRLGLG